MAEQNVFIYPNHSGPTMAVGIDEDLCIGCNSCADICRIQTLLPNPEKGKPPILAYPDECWYCGCCVEACPTGALQMRLPINQRIFFKDRETGEIFRIGGAESPAKSFFLPPYGWLDHNELNGLWRALERKEKPIVVYVHPDAGTEIGRYFAEKEVKNNIGKIKAILKDFGVSKVIISENPVLNPEETVVYVGNEPHKADYTLSVKQLSNMIYRGCVSKYTAIHFWREVKEGITDD